MATCPHCGETEARPGGFCPACGEKVPEAEPETVELLPALDELDFSPPPPPVAVAPSPPITAPPPPAKGRPGTAAPVRDSEHPLGRERAPGKKAGSGGMTTLAIPRATVERARDLAREPHASLELTARYEFTSVPVDDPPLMGVMVEIEAFGKPFERSVGSPVAHVILALDVSASMNIPGKYPVLKKAVGRMLEDFRAEGAPEVLLSLVIFAHGADTVLRGVSARNVNFEAVFRTIEGHKLCFGDYTEIPGALSRAGRIALDQARGDRTMPVRIYLLTDGKPQHVEGAITTAGLLSKVPADIHALAFGADADISFLQGLFAGQRGGTVKTVRSDTLETAFERVAETAQKVVATRCFVELDLAPGAVGGDAFRYRPGRVRFPEPAFADGKRFRADLGTIETGRKYSLLFEVRPPEVDETVTRLGEAVVRIPGFGGPIEARLPLTLTRTARETLPGDVDAVVRTARDILSALSNADPKAALRALRLRRTIYAEERRDPGLLAIIDRAIGLLETAGSLDSLSPDDYATLLSHTCT
jgi:uncharacterized protein YegL